jgi:hypothetical protein
MHPPPCEPHAGTTTSASPLLRERSCSPQQSYSALRTIVCGFRKLASERIEVCFTPRWMARHASRPSEMQSGVAKLGISGSRCGGDDAARPEASQRRIMTSVKQVKIHAPARGWPNYAGPERFSGLGRYFHDAARPREEMPAFTDTYRDQVQIIRRAAAAITGFSSSAAIPPPDPPVLGSRDPR